MTRKTEKEKMLAGELYLGMDAALLTERQRAQCLLAQYNVSLDEQETRTRLLRELVGAVGENVIVQPIFACDYGYNIQFGRNIFINYHCVFLDCARIEIGDNVQIGPCAQLYTAQHPIDPAIRRSGLESARPIRIDHDVWIGGGAIILPGVTIGAFSVVGAGSVVVHDVPPGTVVAGNPARLLRTIEVKEDNL